MVLPVAAMVVTGCAQQVGPKETGGTLAGAIAGGLLGAQFGSGEGQLITTAAGTLIGALAGGEAGRSLDRADRLSAASAVDQAQVGPIGETIIWDNPDTGNRGTVTPVREGTSTEGRYCREFVQSITIAGETQQGYGIACQEPDGSWRIVQTQY